MRLSIATVASVSLLMGCVEHESPNCMFVFDCTDAPPTPRGAWSISVARTADSCPTPKHEAMVGEVSNAAATVMPTDQGPEGVAVTCTVSGAQSFAVNAQEQQFDRNLELNILDLPPAATLDNPATATLAYSSKETRMELLTSDPKNPCRVFFVSGSGETVHPGAVWAAFSCPSLIGGTSACVSATGVFAFAGCAEE
jgi:hypothetical protein